MSIWKSVLGKRFIESGIEFFNKEKKIDWEQRRYEIAKDLFTHFENLDAEDVVNMADSLIEQLKKK